MKIFLKILIPIVIILMGTVFLGQNLVNRIVSPPQIEIEEALEVSPEITVDLVLDFAQGNIKTFKAELKTNQTVFDLLEKVTQENNLELSFKESPGLGVFVESINNFKNDFQKNLWWQYWVNGEYAKIGASDFQLKNGDLVEWKYIESQF